MLGAGKIGKEPVTFSKDVAPILQKNCQGCHRPGEAAPMSLLSYQEARPWAAAIREAVILKRMPPWYADSHFGKFSNDRSLSKADIDTLVSWANSGAPEGDSKQTPKPAAFVDGWNIGTPDLVLEMVEEYRIPASGTIKYEYFTIPTKFTEDKWVQMAEVRPGNRALVHHVIAFIKAPRKPDEDPKAKRNNEFLVGYAPGSVPEVMKPGQAKLIKAGSEIEFQVHYTANGTPGVDRSKVGLIFAKEPPRERVMTLSAAERKFVIPAGAANHEVESRYTLKRDSTLTSLFPHMHLRGKDFEFRVVLPGGETQTLLKVPSYSFSWQLSYTLAQPLQLPKGSVIECTAHFDNSVNNKYNPDATKEVRWGDQSWEEMMIGFFNVAFDAKLDPNSSD
jgi:Copper type II ascorbate-dependent monooxygenase, C-terminal domain.